MNTPPAPAAFAQRLTRQKYAGGSRPLAVIFFLLGLCVFIFYHWIFGLLIMLASALVDAKHQTIFLCGQCGNEVTDTSKLCPVCDSRLTSPPSKPDLPWVGRFLTLCILIALALHAYRWAQQHPEMFRWLQF